MYTKIQANKIIRSSVRRHERMNFMSFLFGRFFLYGENTAFRFAHFFSPTYKGERWNFFKLSNDTGYMTPDIKGEKIRFISNLNFINEEMSADAFGIVITIHTLSVMFKKITDSEHDADLIIHHISNLMNYAEQHPESYKILNVIK